jgi:periplasmic protein TonB
MPVAPIPEQCNRFFRGCLVEGDSAHEMRIGQNKRRALLASIVAQALILAGLIAFPLFSKGENIANRVFVPTVPYSPRRAPDHARTTDARQGNTEACRFCAPHSISPMIVTHDHDSPGDPTAPTGPEIPATPYGENIPGLLPGIGADRAPAPPAQPRTKERLQISGPIQAAMLIRRIEPVYPPLARQTRQEGRVELHAIIATDGTIQSLEVLSGAPLFIPSALAAVRDWRYRPTLLNGQPVEVDTHITVVYTLGH